MTPVLQEVYDTLPNPGDFHCFRCGGELRWVDEGERVCGYFCPACSSEEHLLSILEKVKA